MATVIPGSPPRMQVGIAAFVMPGHNRSGDLEVVHFYDNCALFAVIDGIGHGDGAAAAAQIAKDVIVARAHEPIAAIVLHCHEALRLTRGAVLSLASIDFGLGLMSWLGVGNVHGVLCGADICGVASRAELLLRPGLVGAHLPNLRTTVMPLRRGDTLIFATDGIRSDFPDRLLAKASPQSIARDILAGYGQGNDDALVLVARLTE